MSFSKLKRKIHRQYDMSIVHKYSTAMDVWAAGCVFACLLASTAPLELPAAATDGEGARRAAPDRSIDQCRPDQPSALLVHGANELERDVDEARVRDGAIPLGQIEVPQVGEELGRSHGQELGQAGAAEGDRSPRWTEPLAVACDAFQTVLVEPETHARWAPSHLGQG